MRVPSRRPGMRGADMGALILDGAIIAALIYLLAGARTR